jgi:hypothetical protein
VPSAVKVADRLITRAGRQALVIHAWTIPDACDEQHHLDVAVAIIDTNGHVTTRTERLPFWPFGHQTLDQDMRAVGMVPTSSSYAPDAERYIVTVRRTDRATAGAPSPRA